MRHIFNINDEDTDLLGSLSGLEHVLDELESLDSIKEDSKPPCAVDLSYLRNGALELENGFFISWFGVLDDDNFPWVVHTSLGYFFAGAQSNSSNSSWMYMTHPVLSGWLWASNEKSGWYYCQPEGQEAGYWYLAEDLDPKFFYLFNAEGNVVAGRKLF